MIARAWRGRVPAHRSDDYLGYLERTGLADYAATPGHLRTVVLRRTEGEVAEFLLTTFWESPEAIRAFAGDDPTLARYYPEDAGFLLELPERVEHWEVVGSTASDTSRARWASEPAKEPGSVTPNQPLRRRPAR